MEFSYFITYGYFLLFNTNGIDNSTPLVIITTNLIQELIVEMTVITLREFVDRVGSEDAAAGIFGCSQTAVHKALVRENTFIELGKNNLVVKAYVQTEFPNKNRTGNTESVIDRGFCLPEKLVAA